MAATTALLKESNQDNNNYNTNALSPMITITPNIHKGIDDSSMKQNASSRTQSELEEAVETRLHSMFEEMDVEDPLHIDLNEGEWISFRNCKISLTWATIIGAFLGAAIGIAITLNTNINKDWYDIIVLPGDLWLRALKLLVLPLISLMMVILPSRVDEVGSVGKSCIPLYIFTSFCASIQGSIWAWIIRPGDHGTAVQDEEIFEDEEEVTELQAFINIAKGAIPDNIIVAMSELSVLGIIVFFLCLGILLREIQNDEKIIILKFARGILKVTMKAIVYVIWLTPIGMMSLITAQIAYTPDLPGLLTSLGVFVLAVMIALAGHIFIFYPVLCFLVTRNNIFDGYKLFTQIYEAPLLAFATASSAATLPRSLMVAEKAGISKQVYQFIVPLGAAINMDGTATTFPIQIALIAQLHDIELSIGTIIVIALLSMVVSIGTAPIPNAGMVYILMLLRAADLEEYEAQAIGTLFVVEWFNDRLQTAVNVTSDQFIAKIVDDIKIKANKKNANICCGCCVGGGKGEAVMMNDNEDILHKNSSKVTDDSIKEAEMSLI